MAWIRNALVYAHSGASACPTTSPARTFQTGGVERLPLALAHIAGLRCGIVGSQGAASWCGLFSFGDLPGWARSNKTSALDESFTFYSFLPSCVQVSKNRDIARAKSICLALLPTLTVQKDSNRQSPKAFDKGGVSRILSTAWCNSSCETGIENFFAALSADGFRTCLVLPMVPPCAGSGATVCWCRH
jgi:hypothetical protein